MTKRSPAQAVEHPNLVNSRSLKIVRFFVALIWYLSWFAAVLLVALVVALMAGFKPDNYHIQAPVKITYVENGDDHEWIDFEHRPALIQVQGDAQINVAPPTALASVLRLPWGLLALGLFIWGASYLRRIIKTLTGGTPFDPKNPHRIRMIAFITILIGPITGLGAFVQGLTLIGDLHLPGAHLSPALDLHPGLIFLGLIILVLAQVFDVAVKLQREQDLTI